MKKLIVLSLGLMAGVQSFGAVLTCTPWNTNENYNDPVSVNVISGDVISVNNVELKRDPSYKPKSQANVGFSQYLGDTDKASGWSDTGSTQILFNGKVLKFSDLGWTDKFDCK